MKILGISAYFHDSAVAFVEDGIVVAAAQEERFSRVKHDPRFPAGALQWLISEFELQPDSLDAVVFFEKPFLKFERILETAIAVAPRGWKSFAFSMPLWVRDKFFLRRMLREELSDAFGSPVENGLLRFSEHHLSHAASAFYPSPFHEAAILTMDAVGEWATTSIAVGRGNELRIVKELHFPHSLGLLYSAFTHFCGFRVNSGEYKLMGLAPYGEPRFTDLIRKEFLEVRPDGSFWIDPRAFGFLSGLTMTNARFHRIMGAEPRREDEPITQFHMDVAASIQELTEDLVLGLARAAREETGLPDLCLAGGVALNCVANGKLHRAGVFDGIWIQPAAGDAGGAVGAALAFWHLSAQRPREPIFPDAMSGAYLGPDTSNDETAQVLRRSGAIFETLPEEELFNRTARLLADGGAIGWFRGRAEFGPRALGNRSILADPRHPSMQRDLNLKVKFREGFRPFAPVILEHRLKDWFDLDIPSPYMLMVAPTAAGVRVAEPDSREQGFDRLSHPRSTVPAVTHVDDSARIQTVTAESNADLFALLEEFERLTGCPLLVNTSFNIRGEPIVNSPAEALRCFMGTDLDALVIGSNLLLKTAQPSHLAEDYRDSYGRD